MKVGITGCTGFIGRHVVNGLLNAGHKIICLHRENYSDARVETQFFDLDHPSSLQFEKLVGVDAVIHLAACVHKKSANSETCFRQNFEATKELYALCEKAGVKKFIFISTVGVYGTYQSEKILDIHSKVDPKTHYAFSKLEAENFLLENSNTKMVKSVVRLPLVYGPDAPGNISSLRKLAKLLRILPFGMVHNRRSIVHVTEVSKIVCKMCEKVDLHPGLHLLVSSRIVSTKQITEKIFEDNKVLAINAPIPKIFLKAVLHFFFARQIYEQLCGDLVFKSSIEIEE